MSERMTGILEDAENNKAANKEIVDAVDSKLADQVAKLTSEVEGYRKEIAEFSDTLKGAVASLEKATEQNKAISEFFSNEQHAAESAIFSGIAGEIKKISDQAKQDLDQTTLRYENYLEKFEDRLKKKDREGTLFKCTKATIEMGKAAIIFCITMGLVFGIVWFFFLSQIGA